MLFEDVFKSIKIKQRMEKADAKTSTMQLTLYGWVQPGRSRLLERVIAADEQNPIICVREMRRNLVWIGQVMEFKTRGKKIIFKEVYFTNATKEYKRIKRATDYFNVIVVSENQVNSKMTYCEIVLREELKKYIRKYETIVGL